MEVGIFAAPATRPTPGGLRRASAGHVRGDASEVEFLRREVADLEMVIKALHASRGDAAQARVQAERRATSALEEHGRQQEFLAAELETRSRELDEAREQAREAQAEQASAISAAAAREAEAHTLAVNIRLLALELFEAEEERESAREAEASALSIARSYRRFAVEGASRLDEMRLGIEAVQGRLEERVLGLQSATSDALRARALRAIGGWWMAHGLSFGFARWRALVMSAEHREAIELRLETAYRRRDIETNAARVHAVNERRQAVGAAEAVKAQMQMELREATASAASEAERRQLLEKRCTSLAAQLEQSETRAEAARQHTYAELAACREELQGSRREAALAKEGQRAALAELTELRTEVEARRSELAATKAKLTTEAEGREEEVRTRAFLERVLRDERVHAARRAEEAAALAELEEEHDDVADLLRALAADVANAKYECHQSLLARALVG